MVWLETPTQDAIILTRKTIIVVDKIVMVCLDENGHPKKHGKTEIEYVKNRLED